MNFRAAELENRVWSEVSEVLKSPERLRQGLERMIERVRGEQDPAEETVRLTRLLDEIEAKRARFQHLYAEGVIEMEDLRARLFELDATYPEAQRRRDDLETRRKRLKELERDKEELLASYEIVARESLDELSPEDRNSLYRRLNLAVRVPRDGEPKLSADIDLTFSESAESSDDSRLHPRHSPCRVGHRKVLKRFAETSTYRQSHVRQRAKTAEVLSLQAVRRSRTIVTRQTAVSAR
jgi:hypothetical protein